MFGRRGLIVLALVGAGFSSGTAAGQTVPNSSPEPKTEASSAQTDAGSKSPGEPASASAQGGAAEGQPTTPPGDVEARARAKLLYEQGVAAFGEGRYSDAIDKLLEADHVMPNAAFSYNIALVYERMGDERSALRWLRNHLRQSKPPTNGDAATLAKVRKFELALQSQGLQQVSILSEPPGATIQLDGRALGITPFTTEITPGIHRINLALEGHESVQRDFELRPDRSTDVTVALVTRPQTPPPAVHAEATLPPVSPPARQAPASITHSVPSRPEALPVESSTLSRIRPLTWIGLGAGALLLGGSGVVELDRRRQQGVAEDAAQVDFQSAYDGMETRKIVARALLVAGSAVLATGTTLLVIDLTRTKRGNLAALGGCGTAGICAEMRGRF